MSIELLDFVCHPSHTDLHLITTRKRTLRRLYFYTCLSVILFTGGCVSRPHPRGRLGSLPGGCLGPHPGGGWGSGWGGVQAHNQGVSRPTPGGGCVQAHTWGGVSRLTPGRVQTQAHGGCIPACTEADTPPTPAYGCCCGRYASYWNAFLLNHPFTS